MKMAKASKADIDAAMELCSTLEAFERYRSFPEQDDEEDTGRFDKDDPDDCMKAMSIVLELFGRASLFRVVFGMAVILDPANEILDPDDDCLEIHPDIRRELKDGMRYRAIRRGQKWSVIDGIGNTLRADDLDAAVDAELLKTPNA